ncbi:hypothetical protein ANH9381_0747 [Aggregatibacter actinomycetemcomitans ANH9381]|nr:hypothetical protein ANH9381_0747 [Aggregatibacter actinomycetemcomitans ANH9381]
MVLLELHFFFCKIRSLTHKRAILEWRNINLMRCQGLLLRLA